jgi:hypothetical protein
MEPNKIIPFVHRTIVIETASLKKQEVSGS